MRSRGNDHGRWAGSGGSLLHLDLVAAFLDRAGEPLDDLRGVLAYEVVRAEFAILDVFAENEVRGVSIDAAMWLGRRAYNQR